MSSSSSEYKLIYFNVRGLGEIARLLFKAAGQEFEDYRYPIEFKDGQPVRPEWDADKSKYIYEKIPVLEIDGGKHRISQSKAIERFLARRFDMLGSNDVEAALIDGAGEQINDVKQAFAKAKGAGDDAVKKFSEEDLKKTFAAFEKQANKDKSGYWIGSSLSLFDIQFYSLVESFDDQQSVQKVLEGYPALKAIHDKVGQTPAIKKWLDERPKTAM
jgi:glutathione S-transferase